jgi:hypothetical protein
MLLLLFLVLLLAESYIPPFAPLPSLLFESLFCDSFSTVMIVFGKNDVLLLVTTSILSIGLALLT